MLIAEVEPDDDEIERFGFGDFGEAEDIAIEPPAALLIGDEDGDVIDFDDLERCHANISAFRRVGFQPAPNPLKTANGRWSLAGWDRLETCPTKYRKDSP